MAVKALRIFLAAVVLIMSIANLLFIAENWNMGNIERTAKRWAFEKEDNSKILVKEAIERSSVEGMCIIYFLITMCLNWKLYILLSSIDGKGPFLTCVLYEQLYPLSAQLNKSLPFVEALKLNLKT